MKYRILLVVCLVFAVLSPFTFDFEVQAQTYVNQYHIQVDSNGSAAWTITQVTSINSTIDTWEGYQQRVSSIIDEAANRTGRAMGVDANSFEMGTDNYQDSQSKETEYRFVWLNFSMIEDEQITFGDVFQNANFFNQLYGEGALQIIYPPSFTVQSVSPSPNLRDDFSHSLEWLGTQFFATSNPSITLTSSQESPSPAPSPIGNNQGLGLPEILVIVAIVVIVASLTGFYLARRRRKQEGLAKLSRLPSMPLIESEEQKIIKILEANGGSAYQSAITDQTRFSKAKTSQLLAELERKGVVTRYKKGRDKIVTLAKMGKGESR